MEPIKKQKLRVGILTGSFTVPEWFFFMIERINKDNYAEIVLIVKKKHELFKKKSLINKIVNHHRHLAYIAYRKIEPKIFRPHPFAFTKRNLEQLVSNVPVLEIIPRQTKFSDIIEQADIEKIQPYNIDVLIHIGFRILRGGILKVAKHGVWSYHHADNRVIKGGPTGVWESIEGWRETGTTLQILTEDLDDGDVLYRSWSTREIISVHRTINTPYWKAASFIPRKLEELYNVGSEEFNIRIAKQKQEISFYSNRLFKTPNNGEFILRIMNHYLKWLKLKIWLLFHFEQWLLLYCFTNEEKIATSIFKYSRLTPPKDRFWADPCLVYKNDRYYIFLEEVIYKMNNGRGHISVIEMDKKGNYKQPQTVLKRDYHLSYPFVFEYMSEFYMVPETMDNRTIELYKCTSFPGTWEYVMNLQENIMAVDTTIFEKDGKVWMFTNIKENKGASTYDELFLFYADELLTNDWKPHPKNPIVSDVKSARPAGALFFHADKLYRPSQDCSFRYGYATVINEVLKMSTTEYAEKQVSSILPNWSKDVVGTHTLTNKKNLTVIDAWVKRRK